MDNIALAMIVLAVTTNVASFLFGMIAGRHAAYRTIRTFEIADTVHDMPSADASNFIGQ